MKNILIISEDSFQSTVELVMDWVEFLEHKVTRFNGDIFDENVEISLFYNPKSDQIEFSFENNIFSNDFSAIWFRRWSGRQNQKELIKKLQDNSFPLDLSIDILNDFSGENYSIYGTFLQALKSKKKLTTKDQVHVNKLDVLLAAKRIGLEVPDFLVSNSKKQLDLFRLRHKQIITKDINNFFIYEGNENVFLNFASIISTDDFDRIPDYFGFSLFQEFIDKDFEIRTFFLLDQFYSMAIFSQASEQTMVDFRNYNEKKPNRTVPFKLPIQIEKKLECLMKLLDLTTGSIDLVKSKSGQYYFLEVNPVGQFGMVSAPCNYNLEYEVASYLCSENILP